MSRESWQANHGFCVTCKCGHSDDIDLFCKSPMVFSLPNGTYQCPRCQVSWRIDAVEPDRVTEFGQRIPGKRKIVEIGGVL